MLELLEKMELLKDELDKMEIWQKLKKVQIQIYQNKELMDKIKNYHKTLNHKLRLEIYDYDEIKEYKKLENEINFMILELNHKLNVITEMRGCSYENH